MGTKLTELRDGCFHRAMDDEPMFVLLGRDPGAPDVVDEWADQRERDIDAGRKPSSDMESVHEARVCAQKMRAWREENDGAWREGMFAGHDEEPRRADDGKGVTAHEPHTDGEAE